jgi:hypothetical protein
MGAFFRPDALRAAVNAERVNAHHPAQYRIKFQKLTTVTLFILHFPHLRK